MSLLSFTSTDFLSLDFTQKNMFLMYLHRAQDVT